MIRRATPADAAALAAVLAEAFAPYRPLYTPAGYAATVLDADALAARLPEGPVWVVEEDGVVLGTVAARRTAEGCYVRSMAVRAAARGRGAGRALLETVEAWARAEGCDRLYLCTTPFLERAIRLYERYGFTRTDDGPADWHGTPLIAMERPLPARAPAGAGRA